MKLPALADIRIGVIGLGYAGPALAVHRAERRHVIGFVVDLARAGQARPSP